MERRPTVAQTIQLMPGDSRSGGPTCWSRAWLSWKPGRELSWQLPR